jgi:hypothetical protein
MNMPTVNNPFSHQAPAQNSGAMAQSDQARQIAEIQSRMLLARMNPRDPAVNVDRILNACTRPGLAESAVYQYARGGTDITGPSIRLAETIAQEWCNFEFGFRELHRGIDSAGVGYSDVEAYAWDLEKNSKRPIAFRLKHWRDTKKGGYRISDERDIYELIANQAQRRVRACIIALIPGDIIEMAVKQCENTLHAQADTSPEAIKKMIDAFSGFGVTKAQIEKRIQRRLESITPAQIVNLKKIYASLRDQMSSADEWFEADQPPESEEPKTAKPSRADAAREALNKRKVEKEQVEAPVEEPAPDYIYEEVPLSE